MGFRSPGKNGRAPDAASAGGRAGGAMASAIPQGSSPRNFILPHFLWEQKWNRWPDSLSLFPQRTVERRRLHRHMVATDHREHSPPRPGSLGELAHHMSVTVRAVGPIDRTEELAPGP